MDSEEEADVFSDQSPQRAEEEEEKEEEEEEDARIFNAWMQRCRGGGHNTPGEEGEEEEEEEEGRRPESGLAPPVRVRTDRRASLPSPATLSSMQLSHLWAPVTARVLLHRSSSRRLLPDPQEATPTERRSSLRGRGILPDPQEAPPTIPEVPPPERRPSLIPTIPEAVAPERRRQFRRRNAMSLSDAYSVCLICHNELSRGSEGTRELQCSHTFHRECIEEWLWRKPSCPSCHVQVSAPQPARWSSTRVKVP